MRILFVSYQIYPCYTGGTEVFNHHLARELSRSAEVTLFTWCDREIEGVATVMHRRRRPARYLTPLRLASFIIGHRRGFDVVFLSYSRSHWFEWTLYPILKKLCGIRYIITIHGGGLTPWRPYGLYRWSFRNAFRLIGISERICDEYQKRTGREVRYLPPLFPFRKGDRDPAAVREDLGLPAGARAILYVGSLKKLKSPGTLIEAFNSLEEEFVIRNNLHLVIAGDGPLRGDLERGSRHRDRTIFLGNVPREEIPDLYGIADLYVMTSRFEGTPLSLLEALFNSVPVVGSDVGGINAIIESGRNGLLFEQGDHVSLAAAIRALVIDREQRAALVEEGRKTYESRFDFKAVLNAYLEIFREAADEE